MAGNLMVPHLIPEFSKFVQSLELENTNNGQVAAKDSPCTARSIGMFLVFNSTDSSSRLAATGGAGDRSMLRAPSPLGGRSSSFTCRSRSAPHSRSSSCRKARRGPGGGGGLMGGMAVDERRENSSMSFEEAICAKLNELKMVQAEDCYVVRQFDTSPKVCLLASVQTTIPVTILL